MGWEGLLSSWAWGVVGLGVQKEGGFHMIELLILFASLAFIICSLKFGVLLPPPCLLPYSSEETPEV